eukprot:1695379-Rhodomonas_salina.1
MHCNILRNEASQHLVPMDSGWQDFESACTSRARSRSPAAAVVGNTPKSNTREHQGVGVFEICMLSQARTLHVETEGRDGEVGEVHGREASGGVVALGRDRG